MKWYPSDGSNPFRKIHIFARALIIYDGFDLTGYAIFPSRHTRSFERLQDVTRCHQRKSPYRRWNEVVCLLS